MSSTFIRNLAQKVLVVAEIGNNHEGSFSLAEELVERAVEAGVGAVKFQVIVPEKLISPLQKERIQQLKKFQLSYAQYEKLSQLAQKLGVLFLATPFDLESAEFLAPLVPAFKIASGDNTFYPLLEKIISFGKPIILSSGLLDLDGLIKVRDFIYQTNKEAELAVLHCVSSYPVPPEQANLAAISQLKQKLQCMIGYSDHTIGIDAAMMAVALGARIIEKHFTIDNNYSDFRDHKLSSNPEEMASLVRKIKTVEALLGNGDKKVESCEQASLQAARRSIVAKRDLEKGEMIGWNDIDWLRPGGNLAPGQEHLVLNKVLTQSIKKGEPLCVE